MDPFSHGDTIILMFSAVYNIYYDISGPRDLFYRVMKVLHQIGKTFHGFVHDTATSYT